MLREETMNLINKFEALKRFAIENKICIPSELESVFD